MVQVFGKVSYDAPSQKGLLIEPHKCIDDCYDDGDCILAFMDTDGYCVFYNYSTTLIITVTKTEADDVFLVAFKISASEYPLSISSVVLSGVANSVPYSWTTTETGWILTNLFPPPWKMFQRSDSVTICVQVVAMNHLETTADDAKKHCAQNGWKLSGIATEEEHDSIGADIIVWVDGVSPSCRGAACKQFEYSDGVTSNGFHGTLRKLEIDGDICLAYETFTITNYPCNTLLDGAICGFQMQP